MELPPVELQQARGLPPEGWVGVGVGVGWGGGGGSAWMCVSENGERTHFEVAKGS